ncbi:trypsin-like serine protease [Actinokineospora bangkokensis]|uniref:Peptidase S1 n=1 Tax=Actinokineospora bangkokensis TaxID=1193682 RepID=A0A1Q9LMD7_9PSEU|nr:trypsin-like serine protease [Actinokineospora bangkokensis]OLR93202.1 peptidase S1 [Actinokineospora bangkokensis]
MRHLARAGGVLALLLASAAVSVPLAPAATAAPNARAATFEGDTTPTRSGDARPSFYNGQNATVDEFPGIIAGIRAGGTRPEGQTCTGTVVAPRKILIAAHCADIAGEKKFVYGLDDLAAYQGGAGSGFAASVVEYKKHPKYVNFDQGYDVAVVTVDRDIRLKGGAAYPKVATSADSGLATPGKSGVGYGYGKKDVDDAAKDVTLDKATLPIVDGASRCTGVGAGFSPATMICAGYGDGSTTILPGDSGGPLVIGGTIVGVASWSRSDFRWYSIYGRLTNDMGDWVRQEVGSQEPPAGELGVAVAPASGSVAAGRSLSVAVNTTAGPGGPESATLTASGLPAGVKAVLQPTSVTTGGSAKLTFDVATTATNGTSEITVTAKTASGATATGRFTLTTTGGGTPQPGDFTLGASPATAKVAAGASTSTTITSTGSGTLALSATGLPTGVQAAFQPASITAGANAKLTFTASASAPSGTSTVTVVGTDQSGKTATTTVSLTVEGSTPTPDVRVTLSPASGSTWQGGILTTTLTATGGTGSLTLSQTGAPTGTQVWFQPTTIAQGASSNITVITSGQTPTGTYPITVKATSSDGKTGTATFTLTVTRL